METSKSPPTMPTEGELVAFEHGAAGHQGLSSNAAGDLIIKPCTQAEIDFYEAAKTHPEFQAHMPTYMGKLELGNDAATQLMAPALEQGVGVPTLVPDAGPEASVSNTEMEKQQIKEDEASSKASKEWVPSGGKKIETGLAIVLENAAAGFVKPNVIDLKLGARLWADDAPEAKRQKLDQVSANTTSGSLGFRVAGMKVWHGDAAERFRYRAKPDTDSEDLWGDEPEQPNKEEGAKDVETPDVLEVKDGYVSYNKLFGQHLTETTVEQAMAHFLCGSKSPKTYARDKSRFRSETALLLAKRLIRQLDSIEYVLEHEESRMYSASILVVTEGDEEALKQAIEAENKLYEMAVASESTNDEEGNEDDDDEDDEDEEIGPKVMEVRLIDFAHAAFTPGQGRDENALRGVKNIKEIVKRVIA